MHAKQRMIPWGHIAAMVLLALAVAGILLGLSIVTATQSGAATTGYLRPAVTAARTVDHPKYDRLHVAEFIETIG